MTRGIHQVLGGAGPFDAITNHALQAQQVITGMGFRSEIFADARHLAHAVTDRIHPHHAWSRYAEATDAAVLHYSIDSPAFATAIANAQAIGIEYHNVTPPDLLWRDAPSVALQCRDGIHDLRAMASAVSRAAAVSEFNAGEMTEAGFADVMVTGILRAPLPAARRRRAHDEPLRLLFVGRGIPNKRQDALIITLAALDEAGVEAELHLVGGWGACRPFLDRCRRLAREMDVGHRVRFLGAVDDHRLAQEYADADVFVCLSEHEGYCVPLIEAMAHDLPIVALAAGAVPETLGRAGVLVDRLQPSLIAEAILIARDPSLSERFAAERRARLDVHSEGATRARLQAFVEGLAAC